MVWGKITFSEKFGPYEHFAMSGTAATLQPTAKGGLIWHEPKTQSDPMGDYSQKSISETANINTYMLIHSVSLTVRCRKSS